MPRVTRGSFGGVTPKVAELIYLEVDSRVGPNATFEQRQDAAAAVAAEVLAEFAKARTRDPNAAG
jgi:hypothetical protein